jgi:hypothetical protein
VGKLLVTMRGLDVGWLMPMPISVSPGLGTGLRMYVQYCVVADDACYMYYTMS